MKWKAVLSLAAAMCIVVLGGLLPRIVAHRQDRAAQNQVLFTQVEAVELEFAKNDISLEETLAILGDPRGTVEIPEELASLRRDKVEKIAFSAIEKYREAGVLLTDPGEDQIRYCGTVLRYGRENQSNVFWELHITNPRDTHSFILTIDDRTGILCAMEYLEFNQEYAPEQMEQVLKSFCSSYLTGLGEDFYGISPDTLVKNAQAAQDGSYLATELSWNTELYGQGRVTLFVNRGGFYTYFPDTAGITQK